MTTNRDELRRDVNHAAAEFLRELAQLVESDDSTSVSFQRRTDHLWSLMGRRVSETPLRETWVIEVDVRREG